MSLTVWVFVCFSSSSPWLTLGLLYATQYPPLCLFLKQIPEAISAMGTFLDVQATLDGPHIFQHKNPEMTDRSASRGDTRGSSLLTDFVELRSKMAQVQSQLPHSWAAATLGTKPQFSQLSNGGTIITVPTRQGCCRGLNEWICTNT